MADVWMLLGVALGVFIAVLYPGLYGYIRKEFPAEQGPYIPQWMKEHAKKYGALFAFSLITALIVLSFYRNANPDATVTFWRSAGARLRLGGVGGEAGVSQDRHGQAAADRPGEPAARDPAPESPAAAADGVAVGREAWSRSPVHDVPMTTARAISGIAVTDQGLLVDLDLGRLLVSWSSTGVLRLRMLLPSDDGRAGFVPELEPGFVGMDPDVLETWRADLGARAARRSGGALGREAPAAHRAAAAAPHAVAGVDCAVAVPARAHPASGRSRRRWHYHVRHDGDLFYGLGEKTGALVRNARSFQLKGVDAAGYDPRTSDPLYKHIPFYLVHRPHSEVTIGVFLNNAWPARFDFGAERSAYWPGYTSICVDGGDLDLFLLTGPRPVDVLRQYHELTGFPALPTKASLGYLGSTMLYTELDEGCDDAVVGFVDRCVEEGIPVSGFHLSSGYTKGADGLRYTLTWNRRGFPDPQGFVDRFTQAGLVLAPNVKPAMLTSHPLWARFDEAAAFIRSGDGGSATEQFWGGRPRWSTSPTPRPARCGARISARC